MAGLFPLGQIVMKPQAASLMVMLTMNPRESSSPARDRGLGDASEEQKRTNEEAIREGGRILSVYGSGQGRRSARLTR